MRVLFFLLIMLSCGILKAEDNTKYVYVFYADWCGPCTKMKKEVWSNNEVRRGLSKYYGNKAWFFDSDDDIYDYKYFDRYNITSIPSVVIVDKDGKLLKKSVGYMNVDNTLRFLGVKDDNKKGSPIYKE